MKIKARTAARTKARYVLQNRLAQQLAAQESGEGPSVDPGLAAAESSRLLGERALRCSREQFGVEMAQAVSKGRKQDFGLCKLLSAGRWLDDLHPVESLPRMAPGAVNHTESLTLLSYAIQLGRWQVALGLLKGGADPSVRPTALQGDPRVRALLSRLPGAYAVWLVRVVVGMRQAGSSREPEHGEEHRCLVCGEAVGGMLCWGEPCQHMVCEPCMWRDLIGHAERNEVLCPVCQARVAGLPPLEPPEDLTGLKQRSLEIFSALPLSLSQQQLASQKKQGRRRFEPKHCLRLAHAGSLGLTQSTRQEQFDKAVARGDVARCHVLIRAGLDLDATNEYMQTALFIAAWRGATGLVQLLLDAQADVGIRASCGTSATEAAIMLGHTRVAELLAQAGGGPSLGRARIAPVRMARCQATVLIPAESDHPGAGAQYIDALPAPAVSQLIELWHSLPVAEAVKACCSHRSYFCDVERAVCAALEQMVEQSGERPCVVLQHMRFLHYDQPGGWLAPHIDLSRVDHNGRRSSHTFLLYLTECTEGGETALLQSVNQNESDGVLAVVTPAPGRLLVFPHICPHEGRVVVHVPKVLVRGELYFQ